jgi:hypothetical protein
MSDYKERQENEIFTKVLKAGRRTYFFDVRETKAGDYYLTITESKKNFSEKMEKQASRNTKFTFTKKISKVFQNYSMNQQTSSWMKKEKKLSLKDITKTTKQLLILSQ